MSSNSIFEGINKIGGWIVKKFIKKEEIKTRHFNKIKEEILSQFLNMLKLEEEKDNRMHPLPIRGDFLIIKNYESINMELFRDTLNNHFMEININKRKLEREEELFNNRIQKITKKITKQFNKEFYEDSVKRFFICGQNKYPNLNLHISYDNLMYGSSLICHSEEKNSIKIKKRLEEVYKNKIGKEIRNNYGELSKVRQKLISFIEKALASENLKGDCDFIK